MWTLFCIILRTRTLFQVDDIKCVVARVDGPAAVAESRKRFVDSQKILDLCMDLPARRRTSAHTHLPSCETDELVAAWIDGCRVDARRFQYLQAKIK